jgi:type IV pilus assembly protein PilO
MNVPRKQIFLIVLMLGIPLIAYVLIFIPAQRSFSTKRHEIEEKKIKLEQLQVTMGEFSGLDEQIASLDNVLRHFEGKLPSQMEIHKVLNKITELAEQQHLATLMFETQKAVSAAHYSEMPIKIRMQGDYQAFYQFLLDLETIPRITRITQLEIKNLDDSGYIDAQFSLSVFFESTDA